MNFNYLAHPSQSRLRKFFKWADWQVQIETNIDALNWSNVFYSENFPSILTAFLRLLTWKVSRTLLCLLLTQSICTRTSWRTIWGVIVLVVSNHSPKYSLNCTTLFCNRDLDLPKKLFTPLKLINAAFYFSPLSENSSCPLKSKNL